MTTVVENRDELKQRIQQLLAADLVAVNALLSRQFRNPNMFVQDVASHVSRFQGKQIRPILTLLSAEVFAPAAAARDNVHRLAAVVEMIHTATLVHDDVIDDASLRRHVSTVHRRWNTETSVLFGDYLFSKAFHLAATTGDAEACRLIGLATDRTCEGELNQITDGKKEYSQTVLGKIRSPALVELPEGLQWIQIDLAQPKAIHAVVVWHHLQRQVCFDVVACLSDDPDFKSGVCTIYNNDTDNSANLGLGEDKEYIESNKGLLIDAEGKSARFLRIYGNGNTYNGFTPFVEVEVWGK